MNHLALVTQIVPNPDHHFKVCSNPVRADPDCSRPVSSDASWRAGTFFGHNSHIMDVWFVLEEFQCPRENILGDLAIQLGIYLLADLPKAQDVLWEMIERGAIQLLPLQSGDVPRMRELMSKYADRHMDLADAALIRVAEREGVRKIFTIDAKDFSVYRVHNRIRPMLLP